jgi:hypothetical protein
MTKRYKKSCIIREDNMVVDSLEYEDIDDDLEELEDISGVARCPECKSQYIRIEGRCITCETCGWSKCELYE